MPDISVHLRLLALTSGIKLRTDSAPLTVNFLVDTEKSKLNVNESLILDKTTNPRPHITIVMRL